MADIVLKNRNGEDVTYAGVTELTLHTADGGTQTFEKPLRMTNLYFYFVDNVDGGYLVTHKERAFLGGNNGVVFGSRESTLKEYGFVNSDGEYQMTIVLSKNDLEVGQTYTFAQVFD